MSASANGEVEGQNGNDSLLGSSEVNMVFWGLSAYRGEAEGGNMGR